MKKLLLLALFLPVTMAVAQIHSVMLGTDFPVQYTLGYNFEYKEKVSMDVVGGLVRAPYNNQIYDAMWFIPDDKLELKEFIQETTDGGHGYRIGANYHFKNFYGGIYYQKLALEYSATYEYLLNSDYVMGEINDAQRLFLDRIVGFLEANRGEVINLQDKISVRTDLSQLGVKLGYRFKFKNPRFEVRTEFAMSKNMRSETTSDFDETLLEEIHEVSKLAPLLQLILGPSVQIEYFNIDDVLNFEQKEQEVDDFFHEYGYISSLNVAFVYRFNAAKRARKNSTPPVE